eukprot:1141190-Pelagomonas_calceolata.AAC.1
MIAQKKWYRKCIQVPAIAGFRIKQARKVTHMPSMDSNAQMHISTCRSPTCQAWTQMPKCTSALAGHPHAKHGLKCPNARQHLQVTHMPSMDSNACQHLQATPHAMHGPDCPQDIGLPNHGSQIRMRLQVHSDQQAEPGICSSLATRTHPSQNPPGTLHRCILKISCVHMYACKKRREEKRKEM